MRTNRRLRNWVKKASFYLMMGVAITGCASTSWKEEVLLHDGRKMIVERSQSYGGLRELGKSAPVAEHTITFKLPGAGKSISWTSEYDSNLGRTNFNLLALHLLNDSPYLVVEPNLCLSYNKWGRPNPPYVIFNYRDNEWKRIPISEFPLKLNNINLIVNNGREENIKALERKSGLISGFVSAEDVEVLNSSLTQPQYQTILREPFPQARINRMCGERVLYKGVWILPNDPVARQWIDRQKK